MRAKPGKKISASAKGKLAAVFAKKYADKLSFRGSSKVAKRNLENTGYYIGNPAMRGYKYMGPM